MTVGFIDGFLAIVAADGLFENVDIAPWQNAVASGVVGMMRATREFLLTDQER